MNDLSEAGGADRQICCSMTAVLLRLVRSEGGDSAVAEVLDAAGSCRDVTFLENIENWISHAEAMALLVAATRVTGDPSFAQRVGAQAVRQLAGSTVATLLRSLGSPEAVLSSITVTATKFSTVTELEAIDARPGRATVKAVARDGFPRHPLHCDWTRGLLSTPTELFGLPQARVEETECQARGGSQCLYTISWDEDLAAAAADPQQRVTALEAQMIAMSARLESAYATASDLVSPDELDTVLARIVDRAANAVRAPSYVLAVRPDADGELQVYSHGLERDEALEVGRAALESRAHDGSALVADVASSRRSYGCLVARYPSGMQFFPQERQMLRLYAKHAAAVLDMAVALQEADRRHEHVSALFSLSQAVARAGTSREVAERLADEVPEVIGCERASVWLWDEDERSLRVAAAFGTPPEHQALVEQLSIGEADTPLLASLLRDPQPLFVTTESDDAFIHTLMDKLGVTALVIVPIVVRDAFLGVLAVAAVEWPERLRRAPDLVERLSGVAALAAPAIQNGRLIDALAHKASHDDLTGLLNRAGFGHAIDSALGSAHTRTKRVGLLFVDLDGFKQVNDAYGHDAGDDLLREAAERLVSVVRERDVVARLGGDEFAVILPHVSAEHEVRAAAERVRRVFEHPFEIAGCSVTLTASVGEATWPDEGHTVAALIRHADAAMYQQKQAA